MGLLSGKVLLTAFVAVTIRFMLYFAKFGPIFQKRVEVSTPINSWLAMQEGIYLWKRGISPYSGDTFHETPIGLYFANLLMEYTSPITLFSFFVLLDILTAILLGSCAEMFKTFYMLPSQKNSKHTTSESGVSLLIQKTDPYGEWVFMAYLLNPFIIANCLGQTTTIYGNFLLAFTMFGLAYGSRILSSIGLATVIYQSFYPIVLIFPACIFIYNREKLSWESLGRRRLNPKVSFALTTLLLLSFLTVVFYLTNDVYNVLDRTYGFILNVRDLKPNIGLFWYFFTEMFEHFHLLFICTFQINAFIYVIPLTIRFYNHPPLLLYSLCTLMTIFKSYPCVGDVGFYFAFIPMWRHIFPFMQQKFLVGCFFIATTVLAPIQWYLWIYSGSANANFYFGVTIAFGTAQIFLLTDILLAHLKREYFLEHGIQKEVNGKPVGLSLM